MQLYVQLSFITKNKTEEEHFRAFHQKVLSDNLRGAVRYLTDRVGGIVLSPDDAIDNGQTVRDALLEKYPEGSFPSAASFQDFNAMPLFVPLPSQLNTSKTLQRNFEVQQVLEVSMRTTFPNFSCDTKKPAKVYTMKLRNSRCSERISTMVILSRPHVRASHRTR